MITRKEIQLPPDPPRLRIEYKYITSDGKEFSWEGEATAHEKTLAQNRINNFLLLDNDNYTVYSAEAPIDDIRFIYGNISSDNGFYIIQWCEDRYGDCCYRRIGTWSGLDNHIRSTIVECEDKLETYRNLHKLVNPAEYIGDI